MKRLLLLFAVIMLPVLAFGQMINSFDKASADTNYWAYFANHGGKHYQTSTAAAKEKGWMKLTHVTDPVKEGTGALKIEYSVHNSESWGGYTKLEHWNPDSSAVYDWSRYDSVMIWYNVQVPQSIKSRVELRFCLHDVSDSPDGAKTYDVGKTEYYYSFHKVLDAAPGWNRIAMPLLDGRNEDKMDEWNGGAFNRTGWAGIPGNDKLDLNKIKGYSFEFSISGAGEGDLSAGTILFDNMTLFSLSRKPLIFFNGKDLPNTFVGWSWGQSSVGLEEGTGYIPGTNSIKWVQGNEWGNGWTGIGWTINPPYDMSAVWDSDSLKFWAKADEGVGPIRVQLEDGSAKIGKVLSLTADNAWHYYAVSLASMVPQDNTTGFKNNNVIVFGIMAEASGIAGKVARFTNIWTGNPKIDVVAPKAPTDISAVAADGYNLVIWQDVPGEDMEVYNVYASQKPIADIKDPSVELVASKVQEGTQTYVHYLYYPLKDENVTWYYAVACKDEAGNVGPFGTFGPFTNKAKGIPTISLKPPVNFKADGDVGEWEVAGVKPFILNQSKAHVALGTVSSDEDLTCSAYMAVDDQYLYLAFDVIDDIYSFDPAGDFWQDDMIELYMGLYNETTKHTGFKRGAEPDYKMVLLTNGFHIDQAGFDPPVYANDTANYKFMSLGAADYVIEAKIPLDSMNTRNTKDDARFHPQNGMKIRMDITVHDADATNVREGAISFSNDNNDTSYQGAEYWGYTWIGDQIAVGVKDATYTVTDYTLDQNYPNPFNPTTTVSYTLAKEGRVKLELYNALGQRLSVLVNEKQVAGRHSVTVDGRDLSSGIYFYRIESDDFAQTRKMILMK
jgi:hypothetical protein